MDKQNYTLKDLKSQDVKKIFDEANDRIEEKLKSKNLINRKRILKDYKILISVYSITLNLKKCTEFIHEIRKKLLEGVFLLWNADLNGRL